MNWNRKRKKDLPSPSDRTLNIIAAIVITIFVIWLVFVLAGTRADGEPVYQKAENQQNDTEGMSEVEMTVEEADVLDARNGTGRWEITYEVTPDHIEQEKIDDEISENFDTFCDVIYAESGNQGDYGMRLVADCIINRMRSDEAFDDTMHGVLHAKNQFSCIADGHAAKFHGHNRENVRKLAQEELMHVTDPDIYYFRTDHFFDFGTPKYRYKDVYFSGR